MLWLLEQILALGLALGRVKDIYRRAGDRGSELYMTRVKLVQTRWLGIFLHRFWLSDEEGYHDHPWSWLSIVLTGGYHEHLYGRRPSFRGPGSIAFRQAEVFHRVSIGSRPTWTLFIRGPYRRFWGFLPAGVEWKWREGPEQRDHAGVEGFPPTLFDELDYDREEQRRSFAYGNACLSNSNVTREMIDRAAEGA